MVRLLPKSISAWLRSGDKKVNKFLIRSIYVLTVLDLSLTCIGIRKGYLVEANPLLSPILGSGNLFLSILCFIFAMIPIAVVAYLATHTILSTKKWVEHTLLGVTLIKAAVIGHHVALIQFYLATM